MFIKSLKALVLAAGLLASGTALAATEAVVTTDLNVRTGPSAAYQRYGTIPAGDTVTVYGCLSGYNWCDVDWDGGRGWVSGNYLAYLGRRHYREPISTVGVSIGVPVFGFDPYDYHRRHYTGRSWYRDRYLDRGDIRRDVREDRRDLRQDRRELREDRRDFRRDVRQERREEFREDRREDRREFTQERRQERRGSREERREERGENRGDNGGESRGERREERREQREATPQRRENGQDFDQARRDYLEGQLQGRDADAAREFRRLNGQ